MGHQRKIKKKTNQEFKKKKSASEDSVPGATITNIDGAHIDFKVVCGTGTYIRSLANDFGAALGVGGHLSKLCRTRIGNFSVEDAVTPEEFERELKTQI